MAYIAKWNEREYRVEVVKTGPPWEVKVDDRIFRVDVLPLREGSYSLLLEGRSYQVDVSEEEEALLLSIGGRVFRLELQEERRLMKARVRVEVGRQVLTAPMPSKVVKVLVSVGDQVKAGDGVIILEAMKMENELKALGPGVVKEVRVKEGEGVGGGEVLVVIE